MIAWIAGATGLVGGHLLPLLLEDPRYTEIVALSRRPLDLDHPKLRVHLTDFDRLPASAPEGAVDHLLCCLGTTLKTAGSLEAFRRVDLDYVIAFAEAGRAAGATRCVLNSSIGASLHSGVPYLQTKGEAEARLRALGFEGLDVVQPSLLLGRRPELRIGERVGQWIAPLLNPLLMGGLARWRGISAETVAQAMAATPWQPPTTTPHTYRALKALAALKAG